MKKIYLPLVILLIAMIFPALTNATHIMGGGLYYEYLGFNTTSNKYEYRVSAKIYRYCEPGSAALLNKIILGVYNEDPAFPNATSKTKYGQFNLSRISLTFIQPPLPNDSCAFLSNVCVQEGYYSGIIKLDASLGGYHLIADECCRNGNIVNINNPTQVGFAFYAFVPPTNIINSSPAFALPPTPFLCTNDTVDVLNSAIDPDGDLLEYNFVRPIKGISQSAPNPTPSPYPWPIPKVNYAPGYTLLNPLGVTGSAAIDNSTGLSKFYSPFTGFFVIEVEIREYRAGQLIGITHRGLQLIFVPCPANQSPTITAATTNYSIDETDSICFNFSVNDVNNDSLFLTYGGDVFDSTIVNPIATITYSPDTGNVIGTFCWNTNCETGRDNPYQFFVVATDKGCPAKSSITTFTIQVNPFEGAQEINGKDSICFEDLINHNYSVIGSSGSTFNWFITNGIINSGNGTDQVNVSFNPTGPHSISMVETNTKGCSGDTITKNIFLEPITAFAGNDTALCSNGSIQLGTIGSPDYQYSWSPALGLNSSSIANPMLTTSNPGTLPIITTYTVTVTNAAGCTNKDSVVITTNPLPVAAAGNDATICLGLDLVLGSPSVLGQQYLWTPATYLSSATDAQPVFNSQNNSGVNDTLYYYLNVDLNTCSALDSIQIIVKPAATASAGGDLNLCEGDTIQIGASGVAGVNYTWTPSLGLSSTSVANPFLIVPDTGATVSTYSYYLTTELDGCFDTDTIVIVVHVLPDVMATSTPDTGCVGAPVLLTATGSINYEWMELGNPGTIISTSDTLTVFPLVTTTYVVIGTTSFNCTGSDTLEVIVAGMPNVNINALPDSVCINDSITLVATGAAMYEWQNIIQPGVVIGTSNSLTQLITSTTTYIVTGTAATGCSNTDTVTVFAKTLPVAVAGSNVNLCAFDTLYLGDTPTAGYTYSWSPAAGLSNTAIANPYLIINDTTAASYTYTVTVTLDGCTSTSSVTITTNPAPTLSVLPVNPTICIGSDLNLSAFGATNYQWYEVSNPSTILSSTNSLLAQPTVNTTYVVYGTVAGGCSNYDTIQVTISPLPTISSVVTPLNLCYGDTATIAVSGAATYEWQFANNPGVIFWTDSILYISLTDSTTFIIEGQNIYGCATDLSVTVYVNALPIAFAGSDINICAGDTIQLGSAGQTGYTYSWTPATGISNTSIADPTVIIPDTNVMVTLSYILTATNNGCSNADTIEITTNTTPNIQVIGDDTVCAGNIATLIATGGTSYLWQDAASPGTIISTSDSVVFSGLNVITYIVTGTTSDNCSATDTFTVNISQNPIVSAFASNDSICKGDTVSLFASGAQNYTWENIGAPGVIIGTNSSLNIYLNTTSTFVVTGYNQQGCPDKDTLTITIIYEPAPPIILGALVICSDANPYPYVAQTALTGLTFNWTVTNGTILDGQGTDSINVNWNASGPYQVLLIAVNPLGCSSSPTSIPVLQGLPGQLPTPNGQSTVCENSTQTYSVTANPNFIYNWQITSGLILSGNGTNTVTVNWTAFAPATGLLWYTISPIQPDTLCFYSSDTLSVSIVSNPTTSAITASAATCLSDTIIASVSGTVGSTYNWIVTNGVVLSGNGTSQVTLLFNNSGPQSITVTETSNIGCDGTPVTLSITVNSLPVANAGNSTTICTGQATQLNASGGVTYSWSPSAGLSSSTISNPLASPLATTTYTVNVTNANGCTSSDSVTIAIVPNVIAAITATATTICSGEQSQLQATGGSFYVWIPATGLSSSTTSNPIASPAQTTTYTVLASNGGLCTDTSSITLIVNPAPNVLVNGNTVLCTGDTTQLTATGATFYQWLPANGLSNSAISNPIASPTQTTTYTVTGTDGLGCTNSSTVFIEVNISPSALFDTNLVSINCEGFTYDFVNNSLNATSYNWLFGDGTSSTTVNPQHTFDYGLTYTTLLTAISGPCTDSLVVQINPGVLSSYFDSIPNVFTPNNDGKNDCFQVSPVGDFGACTSIEIFNQWGNVIFKSDSGTSCWDGQNQSNKNQAPQGTYMYIIKVNNIKFNGTVLLIR